MQQADPYSLDRLQDIVQSPAVSWWPPAPFWWCALAMVAVWCLYLVATAIYRWIQNAYRRKAVRELEEIAREHQPGHAGASELVQLSALLKRVALVSFPRERVASLSGDQWLSFLSETCDAVDFASGPLRVLGEVSFDPTICLSDDGQWRQVVGAVRTWIDRHQAERWE